MPHYTSADGLNLFYTDTGAGLPVLCLPGLTRNTLDFSYVAPHLHDCRVISTDYRGRGQSDRAPDPASYAVPVEAGDVLRLMDHLHIDKAAILGTSRGGLIGMTLAATARDRLLGVALNDVGPVLEMQYIRVIAAYVGLKPVWKTHAEAAAGLALTMAGFANVPDERWMDMARFAYAEGPDGLDLTYDPALRAAVQVPEDAVLPDLWPLFDALAGLPLCTIRGANSPLLSSATLDEMQRRRPDMIAATVPDRAHVPFLDEPEALAALHAWIGEMR